MKEIHEVWPGWKIQSLIGSGGFGKVYKAKKDLLGEETYSAIKVIQIPNDPAEVSNMQASGMDEKSIQEYYKASVVQLINEIKLMERMKSASHVVAIEDYEVVESPENLGWSIYIRMELLTNLNTYIQEKGMSVQDVVKMGIDVLTGLEFCHQQNLIHRDIKPANIFVSSFGEYKIGDFGISREIERTSVTLSQKGTKTYMAPEIVRMEPYDHLVDIYALGLTLYEIANNGRMPFLPPFPEPYLPMDLEKAILKRLSGQKFPDIEGAGRLNDVVRKACAYDPKERYQSAAEMKADLQGLTTKFYGEDTDKTMPIGSESLDNLNKMLRKLKKESDQESAQKKEPEKESEKQEEKCYDVTKEQILNYVLTQYRWEEGVDLQADSLTFMRVQEACAKAETIMQRQDYYHMMIPYIAITDNGAKDLDLMIYVDRLPSVTQKAEKEEREPQKEPEKEPLQRVCPQCHETSYLMFTHGYFCPSCGKLTLLKDTANAEYMKAVFDESPREKLSDCLHLYEKLLQKDEDSAQLHLRMALIYIETEEYEKAKVHLERAEDLDPRDGAVYHFLGTYYLHKGLHEEALKVQSKAHQLWKEKKYSVSTVGRLMYQNYACIYDQNGDNEMAFRYMLKACQFGGDAEELFTKRKIGSAYAREKTLEILKKYNDQLSFHNRGGMFDSEDQDLRLFCHLGKERRIYLHVDPSLLSLVANIKRGAGTKEGVVLTEDRVYCISAKKPVGVFFMNYVYFARQTHQIVAQGGNLLITNMLQNEAGELVDCVMHTGGDAAVVKRILEEIQELYRLE